MNLCEKYELEMDNLDSSVPLDNPDESMAGFPGNNGYLYVSQKAKIIPPTKKELEGPPKSDEEDIGLLQKMINPTNSQPVWLIHGLRGASVIAASYALVRYWKYLGWLYGKNPFGLLVTCNDKDGWQQSHINPIFQRNHRRSAPE